MLEVEGEHQGWSSEEILAPSEGGGELIFMFKNPAGATTRFPPLQLQGFISEAQHKLIFSHNPEIQRRLQGWGGHWKPL